MAQSNILKLTGFTANVEVLGKVRKVRFEDNTLEIEGLTLASAHKVLAALGTGKLDLADETTSIDIEGNGVSSTAVTERATVPESKEADGTPPTTEDPPKKKRRSRKKKDADPTSPPTTAPPSGSGDQSDDTPPKAEASGKSSATSEDKAQPEAKAAPPVEDKKSNGESTELPEGIAADDFLAGPEGVHEDLYVMSKLKDILRYIMSKGIKGDPEVVKVCVQIKDKVPYLSRMKNIEERVMRTLGVMDH